MDRYKKLASNTFVLTIGQLSSKLLIYVMMRFYTQTLGSEGYGTVSLIINSSTIIIAIITLSIGESVIRFGLDKSCDKRQVFSIAITTVFAGLVILIPIMPLVGNIEIISGYIYLIYIYVLTGSFKSVCSLFVRSIGNVRLFAVDGIFTTIINITLNLLFLKIFDLGVLGYVLSVVLADLASIIFLIIFGGLKHYFQIFGLDRHLRKVMYRFCIPMIPTTVMWWVTSVSDTFFIAEMMSKGAAGIYSAAYKLPNIIALISGIFSQAWNMSAIVESNSRTISKFYSDVFNFLQSVIYILSAGMLLIIRPALDVMAPGQDYAGAFRHSPFLIMAIIFTCFSTFMGSIYIASKKSVRSMITATSGAALHIILNFILIPIMGIDGAALSTFISYILIFIIRAIDTRKLVYMDLKFFKMAINFLVLGVMSWAVMFMSDHRLYYGILLASFIFILIINSKSSVMAFKVIAANKKKRRKKSV